MKVWLASFEAQQIIALRLAKLALGGKAAFVETRRMVVEKAAMVVQVHNAAMAAC